MLVCETHRTGGLGGVRSWCSCGSDTGRAAVGRLVVTVLLTRLGRPAEESWPRHWTLSAVAAAGTS